MDSKHLTTTATTAEIQQIVNYFCAGDVDEVAKLSEGLSNSTYFVTMGDAKRLVVRILREHDLQGIATECCIQNQLAEYALCAPRMLTTTDGECVYKSEAFWATVAEYIPGSHPKDPITARQCFLIGKELARFHEALNKTDLGIAEGNGFLNSDRIRRQINTVSAPSEKATLNDLLDKVEALDWNLLPSGLTHGDLHRNNILIDQNETVAILDLQEVGVSSYVLDLGRTIADICTEDGKIDWKSVDACLEGYETVRTLSSVERDRVATAIAYGAVAVCSWFFQYGDLRFADHFLSVARDANTYAKA